MYIFAGGVGRVIGRGRHGRVISRLIGRHEELLVDLQFDMDE